MYTYICIYIYIYIMNKKRIKKPNTQTQKHRWPWRRSRQTLPPCPMTPITAPVCCPPLLTKVLAAPDHTSFGGPRPPRRYYPTAFIN